MARSVRSIFTGVFAILIVLGLVFPSPGCSKSSTDTTDDGSPIVLVDIAPMHGIVSEIVRDGVEVRVLVPTSVSPHGFALRPSDTKTIRGARQIVQVGAGLSPEIERALRAIAKPDRVITFADLVGIESDHHDHAHGDDDHHHGAVDPHLWLDPTLVLRFLESLPGTMDPSIIDREKLAVMIERVRAFDEETRLALEPVRGARIVTLHHGFDRFCARYGIEISDTVRDVSHGTPSPADMARLAILLKTDPVACVYVEPQFPDTLAIKLAQDSGVRVSTLDPIGSGDWFAMMKTIVDELARLKDEHDG